ncbi:myb-like protein X isoform X2 [Cheilinus undulatus]|uniref:myb-like protein X isoform X2 n=1 Tax=Cheilinus undulatus TaxID=241271 RepID=UPI001BD6781A|nr:myb-like protein X isoform X2 [Cheilinus undulatus]
MEEVKNDISEEVQQLVLKDEEDLLEEQERSSSLKQNEPPEPAHIKEEQEELWINKEREQLQGAEGANNLFTLVTVKNEEVDEEKSQNSQPHENQSGENRDTECFKTEADGEDCGGSEGDRDLNADGHFPPVTPDETSDLSGSETDDSADWEESDEHQEGLNYQKNKDRSIAIKQACTRPLSHLSRYPPS